VVGFDNYAAFRKMTSYLLDLGHRSFGFIAQSTISNDRARARQAAVRTVLAEQGLAVRPYHFVEGSWQIEDGVRAFEKIMSTKPALGRDLRQ
jgi:LacI family transcriptional regulator